MKRTISVPALLIVALSAIGSLAAEEPPRHRRWAVVADNAVRESGVADLLTAELSAVAGLELVERDQLAAATAELEISLLHGSRATKERLELGKLLKADAIVLLSLKEQEKKPFLRLVICDCGTGARMHVDFLPQDSNAAALAKQCSQAVLSTRQRFADGVRKLVAVAPFLSRNLIHDHDNLQTALAAIVEESLADYPGVAVVEVEEAKSIAQELRLTGSELEHKYVTLFVGGEYKVASRNANDPLALDLAVHVDNGKQVRSLLDLDSASLIEATDLLSGEVSRELSGLAESDRIQPFSRSLQFEQWTARASAFSRAGSYREATSLREAALLIKPNFNQRLALIADYRRWQFAEHAKHASEMYRYIAKNWQTLTPEIGEEHWQEVFDERLNRLRLVALHTGIAIRQGDLNQYEGSLLASACNRDPGILNLVGESGREVYRDTLYEFFWDIFPVLARLDPTANGGHIRPEIAWIDPQSRPSESRVGVAASNASVNVSRLTQLQRDQWTMHALQFLTTTGPLKREFTRSPNPPPRTWDDRRTLNDLQRFVVETAPPHPIYSMAFVVMRNRFFYGTTLLQMVNERRFTAEEIESFCDRLKQSNHALANLYGRCGKLALRVKGANLSIDQATLDEADALLARIAQIQAGKDRHYSISFSTEVNTLRRAIQDSLHGSAEKAHDLTPNIVPPYDPNPPVTFIPIEGVLPVWDHLLKCNDTLDLMWTNRAVYSMPAPRNVVELFAPEEPRDAIAEVVWDGQYAWIGSLRSGIRVVASDGTLVARVTSEQGLPPFDDSAKQDDFIRQPKRALMLYPLGPGRCIAIGRFGSRNRVWCAVIEPIDAEAATPQFQARVFHSATTIGDKSHSVDCVFELKSLAEISDWREPSRKLLLVGRGLTNNRSAVMHPLAIDLKTLEVSVFPGKIALPAHASSNGRWAFHAHLFYLNAYTAPPKAEQEWSHRTLANTQANNSVGQHVPFVLRWLLHESNIYNPGPIWRSLDPNAPDPKLTTVNQIPLPNRHRYKQYGVSAHYGPVAWHNHDRYFQVKFGQPVEANDLPRLYPEVPPTKRAEHHRAVITIRELGGYVDALWGVPAWKTSTQPEHRSWFTHVHLPREWTGGDDGLRHLAALHNVQSLSVVEATVSNDGLSAIGRLSDLRALHLVEARATDAGLIHLQSLPRLSHLRLEGTAGGKEFSDEGMSIVGQFPAIGHVQLYGRGFTGDGLKAIYAHGRTPSVDLIETTVTKTGLSELRKQIPGLRAGVHDK